MRTSNASLLLLVFALGAVTRGEVRAEEIHPATEADPSEKPPKKKKPHQDSSAKDPDSGDTYNFYFQKGSGPGKVQQGGTSASETSSSAEVPPGGGYTQRDPKKTSDVSSADVFAGLALVPGRSATGLTLGADFLTHKPVGFRVEIFELNGARESSSSFGAGGSFDSSSEHHIFAGNFGVQFNLFGNTDMRVAPTAGLLIVNDKDSISSSRFGSFGSKDETTGDSKTSFLPYGGATGALYFSKSFGANASILVPVNPKYAVFSLGFVLRL